MKFKMVSLVLLIATVFVAGCIGQSPTGAAVSDSGIIEFHGAECPHCHNMEPVVAQVEADLGIEITKLEVWHNDANRRIFYQYQDIVEPACGGGMGVPAFVNTKTHKAVCGEMSADALKAFITG